MSELLDMLIASFGVPERVFRGEECAASFLASAAILAQLDEKLLPSQRKMIDRIIGTCIDKMLETAFPEWYWEPMFLMSPRGTMMKRRDKPLELKVEWTR